MEKNHQHSVEYWKKLVVVLCFGWVAIWIYRTVLTPIYPEIQASLGGISDAEIGAIASFYYLAYCCMQIPCGILVDKLGQKVMLAGGFSLFIIGTLLLASAHSLSLIYVGSLLAGAGCASFFCSAYSLSSQNVPETSRAMANAIINSGSAIGMGIGLIGSTVLVKNMNMNWQHVMFMIVAILVVMVAVFLLAIRSHQSQPLKAEEKADQAATGKVPLSVMFTPKLCSAYFLYFCTCYGYYLIVTWLPSFLQTERGFEGMAIGFASALVAFAGIPGALFFSRLSDKFSNKKVKILLYLEGAAALLLLLTVMAPNTWVLMTSLIFYGLLGKLAVDPILISYVSEQASPKSLGRTFSLLNFFGMSSAVIAPTLTGFISDVMGSKEMSFIMSGALVAVGACIFALITHRSKVREVATA